MSTPNDIRTEIEAVAAIVGKAASTVGEMTGQGGQFYARLCQGKRVWPETAERVMARLAEIKARHIAASVSVACDASHATELDQDQVDAPKKVNGGVA